MDAIEVLLTYFTEYLFIPVTLVAGFVLLRYKNLPGILQKFSWYLLLAGVVQPVSTALYLRDINNMPLLHFFVVTRFVCLIFFYQQLLRAYIHPSILKVIGVLFVAFSLVNTLFIQPVTTFNTYAITVESTLVIILSLTTFIVLLNDTVREKKAHLLSSINWINAGIFIYYTSSLLITNSASILDPSKFPKTTWYLWQFHAITYATLIFCGFMGLWKRPSH